LLGRLCDNFKTHIWGKIKIDNRDFVKTDNRDFIKTDNRDFVKTDNRDFFNTDNQDFVKTDNRDFMKTNNLRTGGPVHLCFVVKFHDPMLVGQTTKKKS
jgi:hypothetical protein